MVQIIYPLNRFVNAFLKIYFVNLQQNHQNRRYFSFKNTEFEIFCTKLNQNHAKCNFFRTIEIIFERLLTFALTGVITLPIKPPSEVFKRRSTSLLCTFRVYWALFCCFLRCEIVLKVVSECRMCGVGFCSRHQGETCPAWRNRYI